jgi:hypothetical protein
MRVCVALAALVASLGLTGAFQVRSCVWLCFKEVSRRSREVVECVCECEQASIRPHTHTHMQHLVTNSPALCA